MGSGISTRRNKPPNNETAQMGVSKVQAALEGKPLDAGDINNLDQAKEEIRQLRQLISSIADAGAPRKGSATTSIWPCPAEQVASHDQGQARGRAAICANAIKATNYEHVVIEKPEETHELILKTIEKSVLFKSCGKEDLAQLVEAFGPINFQRGAEVITQEEEGDDFYVVEEGSLRCFVVFPGGVDEVEVRTPYVRGESFGELALMYNNPRAATLRAADDCKLWFIKRAAVRAILTSRRENTMAKRVELLKNVVIGDANLTQILSKSEVEQLVNALEEEEFFEGECIVREGDVGHSFYILQSGCISVYKRGSDEAEAGAIKALEAEGFVNEAEEEAGHDNDSIGPVVATLTPGSYFGERALLSAETREATCIACASGLTVCLSLGREDFGRMLGSLEDVMKKAACIKEQGHGEEVNVKVGSGNHSIDIRPEDLEVVFSLGQGAFGNVKLVLHKPSGAAYALKCQGKRAIVANELQAHIMDERRLLMELDHPFILKLHASFQDDRYIYFVLEALLGGEIFSHLRRVGSFEEPAVKFYAATVLCALQHMHDSFIAYRDLKPENLVLDAKGYIKIVDLGLAKIVPTGYAWTICGTPDYLAPEIILNEGHDQAVDFWALGVLIYEMLAGVAPFYATDPMSTYENILANRVQPPSYFSKPVKDIVRRLLKINKSKRLGKTAGGARGVKKHKWFSGFDWEALMKKDLDVPIHPALTGPFDTSNFNPPGPAQEESEPCREWTPDF